MFQKPSSPRLKRFKISGRAARLGTWLYLHCQPVLDPIAPTPAGRAFEEKARPIERFKPGSDDPPNALASEKFKSRGDAGAASVDTRNVVAPAICVD